MNKVIKTEKIPIKLWLDEMDEKALNQAKNLANLPFAFKHIAIMPDSHPGYGMPIGGVLATQGVIIPNAVGVDIGCGMCAVRTNLTEMTRQELQDTVSLIRKKVPLGFNWHKEPQAKEKLPKKLPKDTAPVVFEEYKKARFQLGSLGGGNHFIEIQKGSDGYIWLMIHSGSRNLGKQVADRYNNIAKEWKGKNKTELPKSWQLDYLSLDTHLGERYLKEMTYCVDFALANRQEMMEQMQASLLRIKPEVRFDSMINIAHNYANLESHFGKPVMVHRKGATQALKGQIGIIPGSQGTKSYIVQGKGNTESFTSCSHGAGRVLGRKQAIRELNLEEEKKKLDLQGILHSIHRQKDLDEAPSAYKCIDQVMQDQKDLVDIMVELSPLAVIKG